MSDQLLSFIVGCHDRPILLGGFLATLAAQKDRRWEVIIVDEADEGDTRNARVVDDFKRRVAIAPHQVGYVRRHTWARDWHQTAKKEGARHANGTFFAFPNDDVWYAPTFVGTMLGTAETLGLDLVYCDWLNPEFGYRVHDAAPCVGHIDVGGFIVSRRAWITGREGGWWKTGRQTGDGEFVEAVVTSKQYRHGKAPGILYVKN